MQMPERFIAFAAFDSATNAERNVLTFRAVVAPPLLGGEGWGEGGRFPTTMSRCLMMQSIGLAGCCWLFDTSLPLDIVLAL